MQPRDIKPPEHHNKALRIVVGCAVIFVVLVIASIACASYLFTAPPVHNHEEDTVGGEAGPTRHSVRSFFELQDDGAQRVRADIDLALGHVTTATAERGTLFQAEGVVVSHQLRPRFFGESDGHGAEVSLSLDGEDVSLRGLRGTGGSRWQLYFADSKTLDLDLSLGAADADLNFTGIPLERLNLECGMASASLRFDEPNPVVLRHLDIEAGLSEFSAFGLGNARFEAFEFDGGAGEFTLDFSGDSFTPGARAELNVGVSSLTVLLPAGLPVMVEAPASFMTKISFPDSFERVGSDTWASPGTSEDTSVLFIEIDAGPGNVEVKLVD